MEQTSREILESNESSKPLATYVDLLKFMFENKIEKEDLALACKIFLLINDKNEKNLEVTVTQPEPVSKKDRLVSLKPFQKRVDQYHELLRKGVTQTEQLKATFLEIQDFSFSREAMETVREELRQEELQTNQTENDLK